MKGFIKDEIPSRWDENKMTHDELLAKIKQEEDFLKTQCFDGNLIGTFTVTEALRAVVELHKNYRLDGIYYECSTCGKSTTHCQTIKAIEKELR